MCSTNKCTPFLISRKDMCCAGICCSCLLPLLWITTREGQRIYVQLFSPLTRRRLALLRLICLTTLSYFLHYPLQVYTIPVLSDSICSCILIFLLQQTRGKRRPVELICRAGYKQRVLWFSIYKKDIFFNKIRIYLVLIRTQL